MSASPLLLVRKGESLLEFCTHADERNLNLRIEVEEGVQTHAQLRLNLFPAAFEHMHRDVRLIAVLQLYGRIAHCCNLVRR